MSKFFFTGDGHTRQCFRPYLDPSIGFGGDPPHATTRKRNSMRVVFFNDSKLKIANVRRARYRLPIHHEDYLRVRKIPRFDLDHSSNDTSYTADGTKRGASPPTSPSCRGLLQRGAATTAPKCDTGHGAVAQTGELFDLRNT